MEYDLVYFKHLGDDIMLSITFPVIAQNGTILIKVDG